MPREHPLARHAREQAVVVPPSDPAKAQETARRVLTWYRTKFPSPPSPHPDYTCPLRDDLGRYLRETGQLPGGDTSDQEEMRLDLSALQRQVEGLTRMRPDSAGQQPPETPKRGLDL